MLLLLGVDVLVVKGDEMSSQPFVVHVVLGVQHKEDQVKSVKYDMIQLSDGDKAFFSSQPQTILTI